MVKNIAVTFDGSLEGFFTIVYNRYYEKINPLQIVLEEEYQPVLETEYINCETNYLKASKVMNALLKSFTKNSVNNLYYSFYSSDENRFIYMYHYVLLGFKVKSQLDNYLSTDYVLQINNYYKTVSMEAVKQQEFCRFAETESGVYYCDISPTNNVLPFVAEFFIDRFNSMNWVIHDVKREIAAIYDGKECIFIESSKNASVIYSETEENYQKLWKKFYRTIGIKERFNPKVQNLFLPKRYRRHMTEFK